jgi:hypothetical protein
MRAVAIALCLTLAACGKGGASASSAAINLNGTWSGSNHSLVFSGSSLIETKEILTGCTATATYTVNISAQSVSSTVQSVSYNNQSACQSSCASTYSQTCEQAFASGQILLFYSATVPYSVSGSTLTVADPNDVRSSFVRN